MGVIGFILVGLPISAGAFPLEQTTIRLSVFWLATGGSWLLCSVLLARGSRLRLLQGGALLTLVALWSWEITPPQQQTPLLAFASMGFGITLLNLGVTTLTAALPTNPRDRVSWLGSGIGGGIGCLSSIPFAHTAFILLIMLIFGSIIWLAHQLPDPPGPRPAPAGITALRQASHDVPFLRSTWTQGLQGALVSEIALRPAPHAPWQTGFALLGSLAMLWTGAWVGQMLLSQRTSVPHWQIGGWVFAASAWLWATTTTSSVASLACLGSCFCLSLACAPYLPSPAWGDLSFAVRLGLMGALPALSNGVGVALLPAMPLSVFAVPLAFTLAVDYIKPPGRPLTPPPLRHP